MIFAVDGMTCSTCEDSIQRAISRLDGVREVHADHRSGRVAVVTEGPVEESAVRGAIEDAGYDVVGAEGI